MFRAQAEYTCVNLFLHTALIFTGPFLGYIILAILLYNGPLTRFSAFIYFIYTWYNWGTGENGGYPTPRLTEKYLNFIRSYFPIVVHGRSDLNDKKNYLLAMHPHGVIPYTSATLMVLPSIGNLVQRNMYLSETMKVPFLRDYVLSVGGISASEDSVLNVLNRPERGHLVSIFVGGAKEVFYNNQHKLVLKNRKGFCKLALKSGASLIPSYAFGENKLFTTIDLPENSFLRKVQNFGYKTLGGVLPITKGSLPFQYIFVMPKRKTINVVLGDPIHLQKVEHPTAEQISAVHEIYVASLKEIFDENKAKYGESHDAELTIA